VDTKFRGKTKGLFADILASQFCEVQFQFTVIFNLSQTVFVSMTRNGFGIRGKRSILTQTILCVGKAGVSG